MDLWLKISVGKCSVFSVPFSDQHDGTLGFGEEKGERRKEGTLGFTELGLSTPNHSGVLPSV